MSDVSGGEPVPWRRFAERSLYESAQIRLADVDIGLPTGERVWFHLVRVPMSVAVVLLDEDDHGDDMVLLMRRYRFAQERWGWELPGGQVDDDEGPEAAAARELGELTGYVAGQLDHLVTYQPMPEIADAERVVMLGREPVLISDPVGLDAGGRVEWMSLRSVPDLIAGGKIWDGTTIVGLQTMVGRVR